jgi:hypothetical protein
MLLRTKTERVLRANIGIARKWCFLPAGTPTSDPAHTRTFLSMCVSEKGFLSARCKAGTEAALIGAINPEPAEQAANHSRSAAAGLDQQHRDGGNFEFAEIINQENRL